METSHIIFFKCFFFPSTVLFSFSLFQLELVGYHLRGFILTCADALDIMIASSAKNKINSCYHSIAGS